MVPVMVAAGAVPAVNCTYTATHAGKLSICVRVFGQHVQGSPFEVQATMDPPFDYSFTHLGKDIVASGEGSRCVTNRNTGRGANSYAIATAGISEGAVFWDAKMHHANDSWFGMGVIAKTAPGQSPHSDATSYMWGSSSRVHISGKESRGHGGWPAKAWQAGDEATFKLDCQACTLSVKHKRLGKVFAIEGLPAGKTWHIFTHLVYRNDSLEILPPSERF
jgi:hypothetical protein